jgi:radical SAM protein with 4Fe4S-binding SPASM domain
MSASISGTVYDAITGLPVGGAEVFAEQLGGPFAATTLTGARGDYWFDPVSVEGFYEDERFQVVNLFDERIANLGQGVQDYPFCGVKELICVVGGDGGVYTCCSWAFHENGYLGNIRERRFQDLWFSPEKIEFFRQHDPRKVCRIPCLYEQRNKFINYVLEREPVHVNFI